MPRMRFGGGGGAAGGGSAAFKLNDTKDVIIPADNADSWVVGSDRMAHDPADTTKNARVFFNKAKAAFRAGIAGNTNWDDVNVGTQSAAFGGNTRASGINAFASGFNTAATASNSFAEGSGTTASGQFSHAEGEGTTASSVASHAEGSGSAASAPYSHAEGASTTASGGASHAEGQGTYATANQAHAEGYYAWASRRAQYAKGAGMFADPGDAQIGNMVFRAITTDALATSLFSDLTTPQLTGANLNVLTLLASRTFKVKIDVVARRTDVAGEHAGWSFEGVIARDATGNAYFVGTLEGKAWGTTGAAAWDMTPSINTTDAVNNYLALTATGQAAKTIRWVASINWVEVG